MPVIVAQAFLPVWFLNRFLNRILFVILFVP
jgi:hypothetical protein